MLLASVHVRAELVAMRSAMASPRDNDYYRDPNGCISSKNVQPAIDAMAKEGFLPGAVDMGKYIDASFLPYPCKT